MLLLKPSSFNQRLRLLPIITQGNPLIAPSNKILIILLSKYPEKVSKHIVSWIDNYLNKSKMKGFVVGVSGGIDSALTSTLCAETKRNVLCIEMPINQNKDQDSRSKKHIEWLKKKY